jgi:hypothetical protein
MGHSFHSKSNEEVNSNVEGQEEEEVVEGTVSTVSYDDEGSILGMAFSLWLVLEVAVVFVVVIVFIVELFFSQSASMVPLHVL